MKDYDINIFFSEEDDCYVADIPDLKYCSAIGDSPLAAVREIQTAKSAWLAAAKKNRKRIPKPRYRPARYLTARGSPLISPRLRFRY